jgi:DNA-binding response OmpR family regulator
MQGMILLVEDEAAIAAFVQTALEREGFAVEVVEDGQQALARLNQALPDLIILDLMLPGGVDGLEVCRAVRRMPTYVPIIMLTALAEDVDKVVGLEMGADDYITKPFNTRELIARVRAVLRLAQSRATMGEPDRLRIGRLEIDLTGRTVTVEGQLVDLTPRNLTCWCFWPPTRGGCSDGRLCWRKCGITITWAIRVRWTCTSSACAANWRRTHTTRVIC